MLYICIEIYILYNYFYTHLDLYHPKIYLNGPTDLSCKLIQFPSKPAVFKTHKTPIKTEKDINLLLYSSLNVTSL